MLRANMKPQQLIKDSKISYFIASLVFRKFLYVTPSGHSDIITMPE